MRAFPGRHGSAGGPVMCAMPTGTQRQDAIAARMSSMDDTRGARCTRGQERSRRLSVAANGSGRVSVPAGPASATSSYLSVPRR